MSIRKFIRDNREAIDKYLKEICPNLRKLNDNDRYEWILNDTTLYSWARSEGVKI